MVGVITGWDILAHPIPTIRCFGWRVFFRAVAPWQNQTFLSLLQDAGHFGGAIAKTPHALDRCIRLELRAKQIYESLAGAFATQRLVKAFFAGLALQEQYHADLLEVCRAAAGRGGWRASLFDRWQDKLAPLEQRMNEAEAAAAGADAVESAMRLVIEIETSEVNEVFPAAVAATDAAFVRKLAPFRRTMEAHMAYILDRIPELAPELSDHCRKLRQRFFRVRR